MKTNSINLSLYTSIGDAKAMQDLCGQYRTDFETKQIATYTVENGLAIIHDLTPSFITKVNLPLPFVLPVNDLGSGLLQAVEINIDTLTAHQAICPTQAWAERRNQQPAPTIHQTLMADYIGLL